MTRMTRLSKFVLQNPEDVKIFTYKTIIQRPVEYTGYTYTGSRARKAEYLLTVKWTSFHLEHNSKKFGMTA